MALPLLAACGRGPVDSAPGERLNVLLIIVDDLRPDLGSFGHPVVQSPNIDRLAAQGVRFDRAYCQFPVCNPSRSSFLTGLRPSTTGVLDNTTHYRELLPDVVTLPELFRENGYYTASIGKVFHGAGGQKGWENPEAWDVTVFPQGRRRGRKSPRGRFTFESGESVGWVASGVRDERQPDGIAALETVAAIERAQGRPFLIAAGFLRPHTPLIAPKRYFDLYTLDGLRPFLASVPGSETLTPLALGAGQKGEIGEQEMLELLRAYYACISFVDAQIGVILDALDRYDLWRNTIVVLLSDHGIHLGEHGWHSKNTLFEVSARVPLAVYVPRLTTPNTSSRALVELIDLYPTLADLTGVEVATRLEGRSFRPLLAEPGGEWKKAAFTQVVRGEFAGYSVRTARWRYTRWSSGEADAELYDHETDPGELVNLAADPRHAGTVAELRAMLEALQADGAEE